MSIFTAMMNSVTGLRAQSFALENISDNTANSQTTGYKRVDTSFQEMVSDFPLNRQVGGSVMSFSRGTNNVSGTVSDSGIGTNFALSGDGFVTVRERLESTGGIPTFSPNNLFTRRGDFDVDRLGYLVNGAGNYLVGNPIDPVTGVVTGAAPDVVRVAVAMVPARASSVLNYAGNFPPVPETASYSASVAGSDIWAAPLGVPPALVGPATVPSSTSFADNSISVGSVRMYNAMGTPVDLNMRAAKMGVSAAGNTTWGLYFDSVPGTTPGTTTWALAETLTFNASGVLTAPAAPTALNLAPRGLGTVVMDVTGNRITQYSASSGQGQADPRISQDGYSAGELSNLFMSDDGRLMANFTNGQSQALAQVAIAQFNGANMLKRMSGGTFAPTSESGDPQFGANGTSFVSGFLEGSNTDISSEFSKMIVTQQAYSANTRVMSTAQQMMQDIMNIIR